MDCFMFSVPNNRNHTTCFVWLVCAGILSTNLLKPMPTYVITAHVPGYNGARPGRWERQHNPNVPKQQQVSRGGIKWNKPIPVGAMFAQHCAWKA